MAKDRNVSIEARRPCETFGRHQGIKNPGLLGLRVKRPRLWGIVLIIGAVLPILEGLSLSGCYITANGQCFESFDQASHIPLGIPLLIIGGLLILAGLMVLSTARAPGRPRRGEEEGAPIRNRWGPTLDQRGRWALALVAVGHDFDGSGVRPTVVGGTGHRRNVFDPLLRDLVQYDQHGAVCGVVAVLPVHGPPRNPLSGRFVFATLVLHVVMTASAVSLAVGTVSFAVPRVRAQARKLIAVTTIVGTALAAVAVADAVVTIPGIEPFLLDPAYGFSGGSFRYNVNFAWGPAAAWYFLVLAAGTGLLGLIAMRAASRPSPTDGP